MYLQVRGTIGLFLFTLLFLLFPNGRPQSRSWGILAWIALAVISINILLNLVWPIPFGYFPFPTDLLAPGVSKPLYLNTLVGILSIETLLCVLAAALALFIRLLRARGMERQQLKWFAYAAIILPLGSFVIFLGASRQGIGVTWVSLAGIGVTSIAFVGMGVASAIAILRYRLWDIDIIIRRTLVYGVLTGILVLVYFSAVTLFQAIFSTISDQQSPFTIVLSTLVIAALFNPLRRRIQSAIDRRFYRRKYDAEKILAAFSASLRNEVDLERLTEDLLAVVEDTFHPQTTSIWMTQLRGSSSDNEPN
jgi:hypothetical protein